MPAVRPVTAPRLAAIRPFTQRFFNPISRRFVGHLPGFCLLIHTGRRTRRTLQTPMNVFRADGDYVFALTYGSDVHWVKNVLAAGRCRIMIRGRMVELRDPVLITDPTRRLMPQPVRFFLGLLRVTAFLRMTPVV